MNPTIRRGDTVPDVVTVQQTVGVRADGDYGPVTERAVIAWQRAHGLTPDGIVGPRTWATMARPESWPPLAPPGVTAAEALVSVAVRMLGVSEGSVSNRGPRVDWILDKGGYPVPSRASAQGPPWCAWFVSACLAVLREGGYAVRNPVALRGLAVGRWLTAEPEWRIDRDDAFALVRPGDVMCRTRVSGRVSDRDDVLAGRQRQGHTGIVEYVDAEAREVHLVSGNSSGHGHARTTGAVARELIREGDAAWARVVGFVRVCP